MTASLVDARTTLKPVPAVSYNGVRVYDVEVDVDWRSGAFVVRGEIPCDAEVIADFWNGDRCSIDGRACRAAYVMEQQRGRVTLRGESFPWRREEWEG